MLDNPWLLLEGLEFTPAVESLSFELGNRQLLQNGLSEELRTLLLLFLLLFLGLVVSADDGLEIVLILFNFSI